MWLIKYKIIISTQQNTRPLFKKVMNITDAVVKGFHELLIKINKM